MKAAFRIIQVSVIGIEGAIESLKTGAVTEALRLLGIVQDHTLRQVAMDAELRAQFEQFLREGEDVAH